MTKKDYDIIAACIGASYKHYVGCGAESSAIDDLKSRLEVEFILENPRFVRNKFESCIQYWFEQHDGH